MTNLDTLDTSLNFWILEYYIFFILAIVTCFSEMLFGSFPPRAHVFHCFHQLEKAWIFLHFTGWSWGVLEFHSRDHKGPKCIRSVSSRIHIFCSWICLIFSMTQSENSKPVPAHAMHIDQLSVCVKWLCWPIRPCYHAGK